MIGWLLIPFFVALIGGVPISFSLICGVMTYLLVHGRIPFEMLAQQMYQASASFPLMAIPFFLLAGDLMDRTGITARLIRFVTVLVGGIHGGLGQVMVLAGTIFAGLSGSGAADTAALTKILTPGMVKEGYKAEFCAALAAATGVLGPIIPPSIVMIVYGSMMNLSVGAMFIAGIVPGLLIALGLMITTYFMAKRHGFPRRDTPFTFKALVDGLKDASLALLMPIIILWGIRGGVFTPTEGGAIASLYALALGMLVYRTLTFKDIVKSLLVSAVTTSAIMLIVAAANPFGWLLVINKIPALVSELILGFSQNKYAILLVINVLLLAMGMLMETNAIVLLLAPILAPIAIKVGVDPLHFALVMITNLCIGLATPPVGMNLFVGASAAGTSMEKVTLHVLPFIGVQLLVLALITYIPEIVMILPRLAM